MAAGGLARYRRPAYAGPVSGGSRETRRTAGAGPGLHRAVAKDRPLLAQERAVGDVEHRAVDDRRRVEREPADRLGHLVGPALAARIDLLHQLLDALGLRCVE